MKRQKVAKVSHQDLAVIVMLIQEKLIALQTTHKRTSALHRLAYENLIRLYNRLYNLYLSQTYESSHNIRLTPGEMEVFRYFFNLTENQSFDQILLPIHQKLA